MESKGFTLIEIIVSLAIFTVVAVIAIGALVRVTTANREAQAIQSGVNNVSFILDSISREMRTGTTYACFTGQDLSSQSFNTVNVFKGCPLHTNTSGDTIIAFISSNVNSANTCNLMYAYLFHTLYAPGTTTIYKAQQTTCNQIMGGSANGNALFYPVSSSNVNITGYSISVLNDPIKYPYPFVFINLNGYVGQRIQDQSLFNVQTSVSQRTL